MTKKDKQIKTADLKGLSLKELQKKLLLAQQEGLKLNLDLKMGKLKNTSEPRKKRKEIARIKTIISQKEKAVK